MATLLLFYDWFSYDSPESRPYILVSSRENSDAVWLSTFTPVEIVMQRGMWQSDEGTPDLDCP